MTLVIWDQVHSPLKSRHSLSQLGDLLSRCCYAVLRRVGGVAGASPQSSVHISIWSLVLSRAVPPAGIPPWL